MKIDFWGTHCQISRARELAGVFLSALSKHMYFMRTFFIYNHSRKNGSSTDSGACGPIPHDGKYTWITGKASSDGLVYREHRSDGNYEYELRYDAGPKDKEWFCQVDCNYLSRLLREGNLQKKEPDVWALRELSRVRGEQVNDITAWWRTKVFLPNIGELLDTAPSILIGKSLAEAFTQVLSQGNKSFEQGVLNIIRGYLELKIIKPDTDRLAQPALSVSRVPASKRGLFSPEHYERKDAEAEKAAAKLPRPE